MNIRNAGPGWRLVRWALIIALAVSGVSLAREHYHEVAWWTLALEAVTLLALIGAIWAALDAYTAVDRNFSEVLRRQAVLNERLLRIEQKLGTEPEHMVLTNDPWDA